jgi:hypothetical protein
MTPPKAAPAKSVRKSKTARKLPTPEATIWTLNIKLAFGLYTKGRWQATVEIDHSAILDDLHWTIQRAIEFGNDHPYEFYVAGTWRSRRDVTYSDEDDPLNTTLAEIFPPPPDRSLFYWFDFGDDWQFRITRTRAASQVPGARRKYPRLIATRGEQPEQYPTIDALDDGEWFPYAL